jgi:uncharacterized membrane protein
MKIVRLVFPLCLLVVSLLAISSLGVALAQEDEESAADNTTATDNVTETPATPVVEPIAAEEEEEQDLVVDNITMTTEFPEIEAIAGGIFDFDVDLKYKGDEASIFDLRTEEPRGWDVYITPKDERSKRISSIKINAAYTGITESIRVVATSPYWPIPDPGEYTITLEAVGDKVEDSIDLIALITAKYIMDTVPVNERYNTTAKAGEDNVFPIKVMNNGTDAIDSIEFTSTKPEGWEIEFDPKKIEVIEAIDETEVDVKIKPPPKTVAGDYMISFRAKGEQAAADEMSVRVTVKTPTIWGWVGVGIIVVVVIGLIFIFMRFSRR